MCPLFPFSEIPSAVSFIRYSESPSIYNYDVGGEEPSMFRLPPKYNCLCLNIDLLGETVVFDPWPRGCSCGYSELQAFKRRCNCRILWSPFKIWICAVSPPLTFTSLIWGLSHSPSHLSCCVYVCVGLISNMLLLYL